MVFPRFHRFPQVPAVTGRVISKARSWPNQSGPSSPLRPAPTSGGPWNKRSVALVTATIYTVYIRISTHVYLFTFIYIYIYSGWWFHPLWKILVVLDHHPNYWGKYKVFQTTNQYWYVSMIYGHLPVSILYPSPSSIGCASFSRALGSAPLATAWSRRLRRLVRWFSSVHRYRKKYLFYIVNQC